MEIQSTVSFSRPRAAALALAAALLWIGAPGAQAQWFNTDPALPAMRIERMVQASGYRLTGPVLRNGPVYLADVLGRQNDPERLVIDANSGRLLQRYRAPARAQRYVSNGGWFGGQDDYGAAPQQRPVASNDWAEQPRPHVFGGWFQQQDDYGAPRQQQPVASQGWFGGGDEETAPPRPPARITGTEPDATHTRPVAHAPAGGAVAKADEGNAPYVILAPDRAPDPAAHEAPLEKSRPKPLVKHRKPEPSPVAQPAAPPSGAAPTPVAQPNPPPAVVNPAPAAASLPGSVSKPAPVAQPNPSPAAVIKTAPVTASVPSALAKPAPTPQPAITPVPSKPAPIAQPAAPIVAPRVVDTKPAMTPQTAAATPAPKPPAHKPAVNDVPVDPLE
jgi:hypothetical protein